MELKKNRTLFSPELTNGEIKEIIADVLEKKRSIEWYLYKDICTWDASDLQKANLKDFYPKYCFIRTWYNKYYKKNDSAAFIWDFYETCKKLMKIHICGRVKEIFTLKKFKRVLKPDQDIIGFNLSWLKFFNLTVQDLYEMAIDGIYEYRIRGVNFFDEVDLNESSIRLMLHANRIERIIKLETKKFSKSILIEEWEKNFLKYMSDIFYPVQNLKKKLVPYSWIPDVKKPSIELDILDSCDFTFAAVDRTFEMINYLEKNYYSKEDIYKNMDFANAEERFKELKGILSHLLGYLSK